MRKNILLLFVISIFVMGCKKENPDENGQKQIKYESTVDAKQGDAEIWVYAVRHNESFFGTKEVGANVSLFKKRKDAINNENKIITATTDLAGKCKFLGLKKGEYFVRVDGADCYNNLDDLIKDKKSPLVTSNLKGEPIYEDVFHIYKTTTFQIFNDLDEEVKVEFDNQTAFLAFMSSEVIAPKSSVWFSVNKSGTWGYSKSPKMVVYRVDKNKKYYVQYKSQDINIEDMGCEGNQIHIK